MIIFLCFIIGVLLFIIAWLLRSNYHLRVNRWVTLGGPAHNQHGDELHRKDGIWYFDVHNMTNNVSTDTEGIYIAPEYDETGASGAWVREDYYE